MAGVKAEKVFPPEYNEQPGMDVPQMEKDSTAWRVTPMDVQGPGNFRPLGALAGPFVGDPYSGVSGLGTERAMITWSKGGRGISPRTKAAK